MNLKAPKNFCLAIARRIKRLRRKRGLSLRGTARHCKISVSFLSRLESGESQPSAYLFKRLVQAFGVSADYLLFGKGNNP